MTSNEPTVIAALETAEKAIDLATDILIFEPSHEGPHLVTALQPRDIDELYCVLAGALEPVQQALLAARPAIMSTSRNFDGLESGAGKHEYLFDVKLFAALRISASNERAARRILKEVLDCATINCGALPDGSPLVGEASADGHPELVEVDGEPQPGY
jgi:hypothetical protein